MTRGEGRGPLIGIMVAVAMCRKDNEGRGRFNASLGLIGERLQTSERG
jgi:hypothetical protein